MAREMRMSSMLVQLARVFVQDYSAHTVLRELCQRAPEVIGVDGIAVLLRDGDQRLEVVTATDAATLQLCTVQTTLQEGPAVAAASTGRAQLEPDLSASSRWPRVAERAVAAGIRAVVAVPVSVGEERLGSLQAHQGSGEPLDGEQVADLTTLADVAGAYIHNARTVHELQLAQERLRHETLHDRLTGLPNRELLVDRLRVALAKAARHPWDPAVLFCDLDNFKTVNDGLGHLVGDRLLVAVATRLRGLLRPGDTLARMSGDEFVVLCEDIGGPDEAVLIAERFTEALTEPFTIDGHTVTVQASIGVASAAVAGRTADELLHLADEAMYRAKQAGGSRFERADA